MQQHGSNYFACRPSPLRPPLPTPPTLAVERSKFHFSEHCHVAYHIKGNHKCSNILAHVLPADPPPPPLFQPLWWGSTFSEHGHIAYQIKGYGA